MPASEEEVELLREEVESESQDATESLSLSLSWL